MTFTPGEFRMLEALKDSITCYLATSTPPRPLCLAVFGPPGSGKSRAVKAITETIDKDLLAQRVELNLTQVRSIDELAAGLARAKEMARGKVPFVFFDEFDTNHQGAAWGWLSWFLAPMHDGVFRSHGDNIELKRAIYVFAGGTAVSFEEFGLERRKEIPPCEGAGLRQPAARFHRCSRRQRVRAACAAALEVLHHQLRNQDKRVDARLRDAMLLNGRYKHGARSLEALIEMMNQQGKRG